MGGSHGGRRPARSAPEVAPRPGADWSRAGAVKPPKLREAVDASWVSRLQSHLQPLMEPCRQDAVSLAAAPGWLPRRRRCALPSRAAVPLRLRLAAAAGARGRDAPPPDVEERWALGRTLVPEVSLAYFGSTVF